MPTKPTPAVAPRWNTGLANQVTPSGGKIALGWEPLEDPSSSTFNWFMFETGEISQWVLDGSSAGAADAHIVETDASGDTTLRCLDVLGRPNQRGVDIGASAGNGIGLYALSGTVSGNAIVGEVTNDGSAVLGFSSAGDGTGVEGFGSGAGYGGSFETESGTAVRGVATDGNGRGGQFQGFGAGQGAICQGGSTNGTGVQGISGGAAGIGVEGQCDPAATSGASAVYGLGQADGVALRGEAANGYAVVAQSDTTSPTRASMRLVPQNADPSTALDGDVCMQDASNYTEMRVRIEGAWRTVRWRTNGDCYAFGSAAGPTSDGVATYTTALSVSFGAPHDPKRAGTVRIKLWAEVGRVLSTDAAIEIRIRDTTSSADVATRIVQLFQGAGTYERDVVMAETYTLPAAGARTFEVQIRRSGGSSTVAIRDTRLEIEGVY